MYVLALPYYHVSFPYLNDEIINEINEQLIKNIPDDDWIKNIPVSQPLEQGAIVFDQFKLANCHLNNGKISTVAIGSDSLSFRMVSTYKRTPALLEFISAEASFQSDDKKTLIPVNIRTEAGKIALAPLASKATDSAFEPKSEIAGKGVLKLSILANINGIETPYDFAFGIDSKSASDILFGKIFLPALVLLIIVLLVIAYTIIKKFMPVKITMEVIGSREKQRPLSMKIKKRADFGSKPGLSFKLDSEMFSPIVGQFQRTGANKWQVIPRDSEAFESGGTKIEYTLGSTLKLKTKDDSAVSVKFKKAKK